MSGSPDHPPKRADAAGPIPALKVLLRAAPVLLVAAVVIGLLSGSPKTRSVSEVIDEIRGVALARPTGGLVGEWWVSASGVAPDTGRLRDFKIECGPLHIAARTARVIVNPRADTFQFELWDVVMTRIPPPGEVETEGLVRLDRYLLGPLPYPGDIVEGGGRK